MSEPLWLTVDEVITLNVVSVGATNETHFVRDRGALEGALSRPQSFYDYEDIEEIHILAAHLILAVGKAHAFEQGNKRTAWLAGRLFLANNGYTLEVTGEVKLLLAYAVELMMSDEGIIKHLSAMLGVLIEEA